MKKNNLINNLLIKLLLKEKIEFDNILPSFYGYHLLYLGPEEFAGCVTSSLIPHRVHVNSDIMARADQLPILSDSIDVVVLAHALEHSPNPHHILREVHRVLIPGGHIVITGFNPYSVWGLKLFFLDKARRLFSRGRIKDWLSVLDFEIISTHFFSGAYSIVAIKRVIPLTLVKPHWKKTKLDWVGEVEGAS